MTEVDLPLPTRRIERSLKPAPVHAGHIRQALASYFDWTQNRMMPEFYVDGGIADLVFISKSGYLTEVEIKCSVADWKGDAQKEKWKRPRPHIARFYYAVPEAIADRVPDSLPTDAGLLVIKRSQGGYAHAHEARAARRAKALKIEPGSDILRKMYEAAYYRLWRHTLGALGDRLEAEREAERKAMWERLRQEQQKDGE